MRTEYILQKQLELVLLSLTPDNRRACEVMLHTGLRIGDVLALRRDQIGRQFSVTEQKTGKRRKVGLPDWLTADILAASAGSPWAFPSPGDQSKPRSRQAVWKDLKRAQKAFRLPINLGTHSLRKYYAVQLMERYGDLERVRRALVHDNSTTTALYAMADRLTEVQLSKRSTRAARARAARARAKEVDN